jgi:VanZ family protein
LEGDFVELLALLEGRNTRFGGRSDKKQSYVHIWRWKSHFWSIRSLSVARTCTAEEEIYTIRYEPTSFLITNNETGYSASMESTPNDLWGNQQYAKQARFTHNHCDPGKQRRE